MLLVYSLQLYLSKNKVNNNTNILIIMKFLFTKLYIKIFLKGKRVYFYII